MCLFAKKLSTYNSNVNYTTDEPISHIKHRKIKQGLKQTHPNQNKYKQNW